MNEAHRLDASINELRAEYKYQIELGNTKQITAIEKMVAELLRMKTAEEKRDKETN